MIFSVHLLPLRIVTIDYKYDEMDVSHLSQALG